MLSKLCAGLPERAELYPAVPAAGNFTQFIYQAQSGLTGRDGPDNPVTARVRCITLKKTLMCWLKVKRTAGADDVYRRGRQHVYQKFVLKRGDYAVNVNYNVQNAARNRWKSPPLVS